MKYLERQPREGFLTIMELMDQTERRFDVEWQRECRELLTHQPFMASFLQQLPTRFRSGAAPQVRAMFLTIWQYYKPYLLEREGEFSEERFLALHRRNIALAQYTVTEKGIEAQLEVVQSDLSHLYALDLMVALFMRMHICPFFQKMDRTEWGNLQMIVKSFIDGLEEFIQASKSVTDTCQ